MNLSDLTQSDWIAIGAVFVAGISAIYTYKYTKLTKELLKIARQEFKNKQSNFFIYLIDSFRFNTGNDKKVLLFNITINNKSENKNSYKAILEIEYIRNDDTISKVLIEHNPNLIDLIPNNKFTAFGTDIRIEEKHIESNWLFFQQPDNDLGGYRIGRYVIKMVDVNSVEEEVEVFLMKEMHNEDKNNKA